MIKKRGVSDKYNSAVRMIRSTDSQQQQPTNAPPKKTRTFNGAIRMIRSAGSSHPQNHDLTGMDKKAGYGNAVRMIRSVLESGEGKRGLMSEIRMRRSGKEEAGPGAGKRDYMSEVRMKKAPLTMSDVRIKKERGRISQEEADRLEGELRFFLLLCGLHVVRVSERNGDSVIALLRFLMIYSLLMRKSMNANNTVYFQKYSTRSPSSIPTSPLESRTKPTSRWDTSLSHRPCTANR